MTNYLLGIIDLTYKSEISAFVAKNLVKSVENLCSTPTGCSDSISSISTKNLMWIIEKVLESVYPLINSMLKTSTKICSLQAFLLILTQILKSMFLFDEFIDQASEILLNLISIGKDIIISHNTNDMQNTYVLLKLFSSLLNAEKLKCRNCFDLVVNSEDLAFILDYSIKYDLANSNKTICFAENTLSESIQNEIKHLAWKTLNAIIKYTDIDGLKFLPLYLICLSMKGDLIELLTNIVKSKYNSENGLVFDNQNTVEKIVLDIIGFMKNMLEDPMYSKEIMQYKEILITDIIFPMLRTTKEECENLIKDPDNFVSLAQDTCDVQKSKILKTEAASLLETVCEQLDGSLSFLSHLITDLINHACFPEYITPLLGNYKTQFFFNSTPPVFIIETSILSITVISYLTSQRNDVMYFSHE